MRASIWVRGAFKREASCSAAPRMCIRAGKEQLGHARLVSRESGKQCRLAPAGMGQGGLEPALGMVDDCMDCWANVDRGYDLTRLAERGCGDKKGDGQG